LLLGYAILAHYSNSNPAAKPLGAVLAIAPPLALIGSDSHGAAVIAWRLSHSRYWSAVLIASCWQILESTYSLVYLLEDVGFMPS
jgi:hypothetical protein